MIVDDTMRLYTFFWRTIRPSRRGVGDKPVL